MNPFSIEMGPLGAEMVPLRTKISLPGTEMGSLKPWMGLLVASYVHRTEMGSLGAEMGSRGTGDGLSRATGGPSGH